ncbi:MAG: CPBP family intramembrane metalloprotease, partial [Bacteroidetes bacterium]|nr:CPBP family intramembrane metalloprotease [Bacteroidota bacterium]
MEYQSRGIPAAASFLILIAFCLAGAFIGTLLVGLPVWHFMTGRGFATLAEDQTNPAFATAARVFQLITVFFTFFLPAIAVSMMRGPRPFRRMGYRTGFNTTQLFLAIIIIMACIPLVGALSGLTQLIPLPKQLAETFKQMEDKYNDTASALAVIRSPAEFVSALFIMAFIPALFEETFFRGAMQTVLVDWFKKPVAAIILTSAIFSLLHFSY